MRIAKYFVAAAIFSVGCQSLDLRENTSREDLQRRLSQNYVEPLKESSSPPSDYLSVRQYLDERFQDPFRYELESISKGEVAKELARKFLGNPDSPFYEQYTFFKKIAYNLEDLANFEFMGLDAELRTSSDKIGIYFSMPLD